MCTYVQNTTLNIAVEVLCAVIYANPVDKRLTRQRNYIFFKAVVTGHCELTICCCRKSAKVT